MKKKNKGFTLIELLAVIVILGIILTIVVSNVVKYIGKAREGAFKDTYAKVLKDVSNKIALNDLGDTEEVACDSPSACAVAYDVPAENISLHVKKMGGSDEKYMVNMTGIGSYAGINLNSTNCPKNAGCNAKTSISSIINTDGDVSKATDEDLKNNLDCDSNEECALYIGLVEPKEENGKSIIKMMTSKFITYIKYSDNTRKFYGTGTKNDLDFSFTSTSVTEEDIVGFIDDLRMLENIEENKKFLTKIEKDNEFKKKYGFDYDSAFTYYKTNNGGFFYTNTLAWIYRQNKADDYTLSESSKKVIYLINDKGQCTYRKDLPGKIFIPDITKF